jgi:hypothetical protein
MQPIPLKKKKLVICSYRLHNLVKCISYVAPKESTTLNEYREFLASAATLRSEQLWPGTSSEHKSMFFSETSARWIKAIYDTSFRIVDA